MLRLQRDIGSSNIGALVTGVLRWEYVRGSTLFVVWDLSQADYSRPGVFRPWSDIGTAFGAEATHTLMVKVSYWINQ